MKKKSLLLIDNSLVLMDITGRILERAGFSVRCALGCGEAREYLLDFSPEVIILENNLPDGNGLEFCKELHEKNNAPIMFTSDNKDDELPALKAGASDYMKKPFDHEIMKVRINILLEMSASQQ